MESVTIFLTDPNAADYPFPYQIGDRLKSTTKNIQGTVRNAKYAAHEKDGPAWIMYYLEADNGQLAQLPLNELEKITFN